MLRITTGVFLLLSAFSLFGQEKASSFTVQGDSRRTFVNNKSVNIFGVRAGLGLNKRYEVGIGIYSSNLFGILGRSVEKNYLDKRFAPPVLIPARIGFHYFSTFGEATVFTSHRWEITLNTQLGFGWVDIRFDTILDGKEMIRAPKGLVEHSFKADLSILPWFRVNAGLGYRYLVIGESQIKKAFNAPIYIVGFTFDLKKFLNRKKKE